jgi:hypothetical protein
MAVMMFSVSVGRSFSDRCEARVAHQHSVVVICVAGDDEIGFIIKAALTLAAKSETVLAPFHREGSNFITSSIVVLVIVTGENTLCGLGPVVSVGSSSRHLFVRVCLSQVTTIWVKEEKVFQFYSIDTVKWRNIKKLEKGRSQVKKNIHHLYFVFLVAQ